MNCETENIEESISKDELKQMWLENYMDSQPNELVKSIMNYIIDAPILDLTKND